MKYIQKNGGFVMKTHNYTIGIALVAILMLMAPLAAAYATKDTSKNMKNPLDNGIRGIRTFYFDGYNQSETWTTNPGYMVDGNETTYASTSTNNDTQYLNDNNCDREYREPITKVEIRVKGYYNGMGANKIKLQPYFSGTSSGSEYTYNLTTSSNWSQWFDIPNDTGAPGNWTWSNVSNLNCKVISDHNGFLLYTIYCAKIEIQVTYEN
jgi:hypothetical protein